MIENYDEAKSIYLGLDLISFLLVFDRESTLKRLQLSENQFKQKVKRLETDIKRFIGDELFESLYKQIRDRIQWEGLKVHTFLAIANNLFFVKFKVNASVKFDKEAKYRLTKVAVLFIFKSLGIKFGKNEFLEEIFTELKKLRTAPDAGPVLNEIGGLVFDVIFRYL